MSSISGVSAADTNPDPDAEKPLTGDDSSHRLGDRLFSGAALGSGIIVILMVCLIGAFLLIQAVPSLLNNEASFLTSTEWVPSGDKPRFGIASLLWVTVVSSVIAMLIAVPLGVCIALFLTEYAPKWLATPAAAIVDLLAAVPSIVFGLWGISVVAPKFVPVQEFLHDKLGWIPLFSGDSASSAGTILFVSIILAIMILPIITALSREVFSQTPRTHKEGALALGATKWEEIRTAVLPFGKPGIISAAMLGLGRALGETVAVMMILFVPASGSDWSWSTLTGGETFASKIANNYGEFDSPQKTGAFIAAGLVLFILTFIVNAIARVVINRRKAFTE